MWMLAAAVCARKRLQRAEPLKTVGQKTLRGWIVGKLTDNTVSASLSCPTLSLPHTLCSVNNNIADLGSTGPARPLVHGPLLSVLVYQ